MRYLRDPWLLALLLVTATLTVWLEVLGPIPTMVGKWMNDWQNLIAASVAIVAAGLTYHSATKQLALNDRQEVNRRNRKHASVRAMLPLALSQTIEYAQRSAYSLLKLIPLCQGENFPRSCPIQHLPEPLPRETMTVFAEFIEFSDDIDASLIETMVAWIQIHDARVRSLIHDNQDPENIEVVTRTEIEASIIDAASIYAAAAALFDFARRRAARPPTDITWENVRQAFTNMRLWDHEHPRLYEIVARRERYYNGPFDRLTR